MDNNEFRSCASAMIYLIDCELKGVKANLDNTDGIDMDNLFKVCQMHNLTAIVAYALERQGIKSHKFQQEKEKAIRKNILLDAERKKITKIFDEKGIWYMPLKGALLKGWYPKSGMRQMSDNDILIDSGRKKEVHEIMMELGYKYEKETNVDAYFKEPIYNFELHMTLFPGNGWFEAGYPYYKDVKERLVSDNDSSFGYRFSNEDFYIYLNAHEYKHYIKGGTGVRSLVDAYIFLKRFQDELDWDYIDQELQKLGIAEFEEMSRNLAMKNFNHGTLTDEEKEELDYYISSGAYGTKANFIDKMKQSINADSKKSYIWKRVFPPMNYYKRHYPWAYRYKILIPAAWFYRILKNPLKTGISFKSEVRILKEKDF